ncbi:hypothetical protein [Prescottella agglutinans]|uniref:Endonuclease/exonuclease/phosphatase family metal-dependent hydrolase n=1 Tax=Prescottella agglutinans TaxID=1644129 RepID=A0ABT6M5K5_9NOCA|nr:hypothetical protein [Prescottella agglutinans]MDH6279589.1 endonuclease/exonuclease/phosphatase family metal-dependent hydrolase [Prescottella agglutinans]
MPDSRLVQIRLMRRAGLHTRRSPVTDLAVVQRVNSASGRPAVIWAFLADAAAEQAEGRAVITGGDFNEPSHLDWTAATRDMVDHNGVVAVPVCVCARRGSSVRANRSSVAGARRRTPGTTSSSRRFPGSPITRR